MFLFKHFRILVWIALFNLQPIQAWILILNGTSSAGKTSLVNAFKSITLAPFKTIKFDEEVAEVWIKKLQKLGSIYDGQSDFWEWFFDLPDDIVSKIDENAVNMETYKNIIAKTLNLESIRTNIVIDMVLCEDREYQLFELAFKNKPFFWALVYASIDKLLSNVITRNSLDYCAEQRFILQPFEQYFYDFFVHCRDTSKKCLDSIDKIDLILFFENLKDQIPKSNKKVVRRFSKLVRYVERHFLNCDNRIIRICPIHKHDFVANLGNNIYGEALKLYFWVNTEVRKNKAGIFYES